MTSASTHKCDVHVIVSPQYEQYHEQCFDSLKDEPINLYKIPAVDGDIGQGRYQGFHSGSGEYVSFVDDDDYIVPGTYQKLIDLLDANPDAIGAFCKEQTLVDDEIVTPAYRKLDDDYPWWKLFMHIHHIVIFRRELVMPYVDYIYPDCKIGGPVAMVVKILSDGHKFACLDEYGYVWRQHNNSGRHRYEFTEKYKDELNKLILDGYKQSQ